MEVNVLTFYFNINTTVRILLWLWLGIQCTTRIFYKPNRSSRSSVEATEKHTVVVWSYIELSDNVVSSFPYFRLTEKFICAGYAMRGGMISMGSYANTCNLTQCVLCILWIVDSSNYFNFLSIGHSLQKIRLKVMV